MLKPAPPASPLKQRTLRRLLGPSQVLWRMASICLRRCFNFSLLFLKGIYHYWTYFSCKRKNKFRRWRAVRVTWRSRCEVPFSGLLKRFSSCPNHCQDPGFSGPGFAPESEEFSRFRQAEQGILPRACSRLFSMLERVPGALDQLFGVRLDCTIYQGHLFLGPTRCPLVPTFCWLGGFPY